MDKTFFINANMTHTFLRYAENVHLNNQKILLLIDDLRKGLSEEDTLQKEGLTEELKNSVSKNVKTCCCIMLHVQCLMDISDDREQYINFINNWSCISAS